MSNFELVAFDRDGTLLNAKQESPAETHKSTKQARNSGKIVCLSTGRSIPELKVFGDELSDIRYFIAVSGAVLYDNFADRIIEFHALEEKTVLDLFDVVKNQDVMIHLHSNNSVVEKNKLNAIDEYNMGVFKPVFEKIALKPENLLEFYKKEKFPVYKLNFYLRTLEEREPLRKKILDRNIPVNLVNSEITSLECSPPGISKGFGLEVLCRKIGLPVSKTIAVGDADNDLEILKKAGLSVAMGNANENVKKIADVVVKDNDNGGAGQVIEEFLL